MLIRKNTKAFKTIQHIVESCTKRADREKLIRLFITRAGHSVQERISTEAIQEDATLYYNMTYETVLSNLASSDRQLHASDDIPGIYFFRSSLSKVWDETPFEFDTSIKDDFSTLPELPVTRKKEKTAKYVLPTATSAKTSTTEKKSKEVRLAVAKTTSKPDASLSNVGFKLKKQIHFTDLDAIVFRQAKMNKLAVIRYYHQIAEYLLPYLKDRPLCVRLNSDSAHHPVSLTTEALYGNEQEQLPPWAMIKKATVDKEQAHWMINNDVENMLLCVEKGGIEFNPFHSRIGQVGSPDYIVIVIDSPDHELTKAIHVALTLKEITDGLELPSFIKTDGRSGLHVYLPIMGGSTFATAGSCTEYICKLVALKIPSLACVEGMEGSESYGKVTLEYRLNEEGQSCIAPYSLVAADSSSVHVATPLLWEEVNEELRMETWNSSSIHARLKKVGDPFETLFKKKIKADELLQRLKKNYAFLF